MHNDEFEELIRSKHHRQMELETQLFEIEQQLDKKTAEMESEYLAVKFYVFPSLKNVFKVFPSLKKVFKVSFNFELQSFSFNCKFQSLSFNFIDKDLKSSNSWTRREDGA